MLTLQREREKVTFYSYFLAERKIDTMEIPEGCKSIIVKNLTYDVTEDEVGDKFRPCGDIKSIRFVYNSKFHHFKGFCFIEFEDTNSVSKAMDLNGKKLKGRPMVVDFEETGPRKGFKFRSDKPSKFNKEY